MTESKPGLLAPVVLVILDGWGLEPPSPGNAIELVVALGDARVEGELALALYRAAQEASPMPCATVRRAACS